MIPVGTLCITRTGSPVLPQYRGLIGEIVRHVPGNDAGAWHGALDHLLKVRGHADELACRACDLIPLAPPGDPDRIDTKQPEELCA